MDIQMFPIKVDRAEAESTAKAKGGLLWKAVFAGQELSEIRQHFVEFKLITFEAISRPTIVEKLLFRRKEVRRQTIKMLANGSTGSVAWVESMPEIVALEDVDENIIQLSEKSNDDLIRRGRKIALKVIHRFAGGIPELEVLSIESIFRPYWVAFYGEVAEGKKVRYKPIPADSCDNYKSF